MSEPRWMWVDSSNVEALGYDEGAQELWVQFKSGRKYIYDAVPLSAFEELLNAPSVGSYLNREIKPNYGYRDA